MSVEQKTILIIEDEPDTAEMFAEMMRLSGFRVIKTYGGEAAMGQLSLAKPDALVLDVMMPDVSGLEVLRSLRRNPQFLDLPVIVVSAKSLPTDIKEGLDAGATIYLTKPVAFMDLRNAVQKALQLSDKVD